jgi:hypothetical protein
MSVIGFVAYVFSAASGVFAILAIIGGVRYIRFAIFASTERE